MEAIMLGSLAIGILCIVISFVVKEKQELKEQDREKFVSEINERILGEQNLGMILAEAKNQLRNSVDDLLEEQVLKTSDEMSRVANEKMLALQEMTDTLLEKIEQNHKEVIFLYDMLNQKSEEMKEFYAQFEGVKKNLQEEEKKLGMAYEYIQKKMRVLNVKVSEKIREKETRETEAPKHRTDVKKQEERKNQETEQKHRKVESSQDLSTNEKILRMSEEGKSVLEISKELEMGQGEVKLILGLYANMK